MFFTFKKNTNHLSEMELKKIKIQIKLIFIKVIIQTNSLLRKAHLMIIKRKKYRIINLAQINQRSTYKWVL